MKKISFLSLLLVFQAIFAMEKDVSPETSKLAISTILHNNPTLTAEKIATFLHIKKILSMAQTIHDELKQNYDLRIKSSQHVLPDPRCGRTKEGLILFCNICPMFLGTPWGMIRIYDWAYFYDGTEHLPTYTLFKHLGVNFVQCTPGNKAVYEVLQPVFDNEKKKFNTSKIQLNDEKLSTAVGSSKIILPTADEQFSIYTISTIDNEPCPRATSLNSDGCSLDLRDLSKTQEEWDALENLAARGLLR